MTSVEKKLLSLNLALLFLFLCAHPAFAAGTEHADRTELLQSEASVAVGETLQLQEENEAATQSTSEDDSYYICVGDTSFQSNKDTSGYGWTYVAELHELFLNGYRGHGISASGDLSVYVSGDTTIEGYDNTYYGGDGISVAGHLSITIWENSHLKVTGGAGSQAGGDALFGSEAVEIYGNGSCEVVGGKSGNGDGGRGVYSDSVYVGVDGILQGGAGIYGGAGVFFQTECEFDIVNATMRGGNGLRSYAIASLDGREWHYQEHTTVQMSEDEKNIVLKINEYTLRLFDGDRELLLNKAEYPKSYNLLEYRQTKEGFEQVGWAKGENILPINRRFCPTTNTDLYAYWEPVGPRDILLQGLDGNFENGEVYQKYTGTNVTLPKQLDYFYTNNVMAWSDQVQLSPLDLDVYAGTWYCGGDVIEPDENTSKVLYSYQQNSVGTALYHPTEGTVKNGGTVIVQRKGTWTTMTSPMDLQTYTLDSSYLTAPDGYELAGWSTSPEAKDIDYTPHQKLTVKEETIQHLYAVWKGKEYTKTPEQGCTVTTIPAEEKVEVTLDKTWCEKKNVNQGFCALYDEKGKLIDVSFGKQNGDQGITLEVQYPGETAKTCKVFGVKDQNIPTGQAIECTLPAIE